MTTDADLARFYAKRRVCVTGGAGFIGSHLVHALVDMDAEVIVIDDLSNGLFENIAPWHDRVSFLEDSILESDAMSEAAEDVSVIFHQAAMSSVPRSVEEPELFVRVNTVGTTRVLECARAMADDDVRIVYASSSSAYGDQDVSPKVETLPNDPRSPYAASKLAGEALIQAYAHSYGMRAASLRYFNIFGPRQRPDSPYAAVIPLWADALLGGGRPVIFGDGEQTRDFTHVRNAVHANLLAGATDNLLHGQPMNIACGGAISLLDLLKRMCDIYEVDADPQFEPARTGDVKHSLASIDRARDLIGYDPVISLDEGLEDALAYYRNIVGQT